jgi:phytoene synthase
MTETTLDGVGNIPDDDALREAIRRKVEAAGTSFYWAMRLLPEERRNGMYAVYAFCREVDDIADDDDRPAPQKLAALAAWRGEIGALYAGTAHGLVSRALLDPVARYRLRRDDFLAVIDGMEMDAEPIVAPDLATLDLYCARVASAVGHLSVHVFGDSSADAHAVADALGRALQLTNILRDLDEDAQRGRLYLPREILDRHGIPPDPAGALRHPALPAACRELAFIALGHFEDAARAMARCSRRAMRPAAVMGGFYRKMLEALLQADWRDPAARVGLSKPQKLWLVLRHGLI